MTNMRPKQRYEIGMLSLGFLGRILVLNMVSRSFVVAANNKIRMKSAERRFRNVLDCIRLFRKPDSMTMFVPSGAPVESIIKNLSEQFKLDDLSLSAVQHCLAQYIHKKVKEELLGNLQFKTEKIK